MVSLHARWHNILTMRVSANKNLCVKWAEFLFFFSISITNRFVFHVTVGDDKKKIKKSLRNNDQTIYQRNTAVLRGCTRGNAYKFYYLIFKRALLTIWIWLSLFIYIFSNNIILLRTTKIFIVFVLEKCQMPSKL